MQSHCALFSTISRIQTQLHTERTIQLCHDPFRFVTDLCAMRIYIGNGDSPRLHTDRCTDRAPKGPPLFKVIGPDRRPRCYVIGSNCVESSDIHLFHFSTMLIVSNILMFCLVSDVFAHVGLRVDYRTTYKYDSMYRS